VKIWIHNIATIRLRPPRQPLCLKFPNFTSDFRQAGGFFRVLRFPPPIKAPRYNWNIVESGVNTINLTLKYRKQILIDIIIQVMCYWNCVRYTSLIAKDVENLATIRLRPPRQPLCLKFPNFTYIYNKIYIVESICGGSMHPVVKDYIFLL
jgi:hypothetical protein